MIDSISEKLLREVDKNTYIDKGLYDKYSVKRGLRNKNGTGVLVGITNVASVEGYTVEDGKKIPAVGKLYYRGIAIDDIVRNFQKEDRFGFEEVIFLLLFGSLPSREDLDDFEKLLGDNRKLNTDFTQDVLLKLPSKNVMNKLQRAILSMYSYDNNPEDMTLENNIIQSLNIISKMPMMIAYSYQMMKHYFEGRSLVIHNPLANKSTAENMLHLLRRDGEYTDLEAKLLDLCLVVHADHGGGNNSAFATHVVSSTGTDIYSALATAIGSLKGPKHGGANHKVETMKDNIMVNCNYNNTAELESYLRKILAKQAFDGKGLIYGMGHAVYTICDPRTTILKELARKLAEAKGEMEEFELLNNIEAITSRIFEEERDKIISANVDLYSGFVYKILGIDEDLYTPIFALARMAGWCAHRLEQIRDDKIIRPAYISNYRNNVYIPIDERISITR
ncbi:MAG TPA: citrate synthase [Clostridiaceae bacterium]|nr:citrate synthase [Clostridiaceae bacterium]